MAYQFPSDRTGLTESDSFAAFAAAAWPRLVRTAHLLTGDFHEAEDLVQTTLVKVYGRWRRIDRDDVDAYVRRALINNNRSRVRKKRVTQLLLPFLPEQDQEADPGHGESVPERAAVMQALAVLSYRQRAVVVLRFYEGLGEQEIATVLNCSIGTVKTHSRRAFAALRSSLSLSRDPTFGGRR